VAKQLDVWWHVSATLFFLPQHIIFSKNIVLRTWRRTHYFLKKIMCCGRKKIGGRYMPPYMDASGRHLLGTEIGLGPGDSVLDED